MIIIICAVAACVCIQLAFYLSFVYSINNFICIILMTLLLHHYVHCPHNIRLIRRLCADDVLIYCCWFIHLFIYHTYCDFSDTQ